MRVTRSLWPTFLLLPTVVALLAVPAVAGAHEGLCASADIDRPFVLPDGTEHPSGTLKLCFTRDYNPVSSLHETYVDRMPVGMFVSRRETSERSYADGYFMVFTLARRGGMRLAGFVASDGDRTDRFFMEQKALVTVEDSVPTISSGRSSVLLVPASAR